MGSYVRFSADELPSQVGTVIDSNVRQSDGAEGFLTFGPYMRLEPGAYIAGFYLRKSGACNDNAVVLDVIAVDGAGMLARKRHPVKNLFEDLASFVSLSFTTSEPLENVEIRLFVEEGVVVQTEGLTVFRSDERSWSCN